MRRFFTLLSLAILIVLAGCGGSSLSSSSTSGSSTAGSSGGTSNILSIAVNGGPTASELNGSVYANAAFASATICAPGSATNCVTVDNLLVDTGSTGCTCCRSRCSRPGKARSPGRSSDCRRCCRRNNNRSARLPRQESHSLPGLIRHSGSPCCRSSKCSGCPWWRC